jgi:hypothetical protein
MELNYHIRSVAPDVSMMARMKELEEENRRLRKMIVDERGWISCYNHRQPHQALGMKTPADAFALAD